MSRPGSRGLVLALTALLTLATWPVRTLTPLGNVDISWQGALHLTVLQDLRYGPDVLFTHGPLGFLVAPQLWSRPTAVAAVLFAVAAQAGLIGALLQVLRRFVPLWAAVLLVLVLTRVVVRPPSETLSLAMLLVVLDLVQSRTRPAHLALWCGLGVLVTAVQSLVKLNSGVYCAVLLAVAVLALAERRLRTLGLVVVAGLGALLLLWVATGQRLTDLPTWVRGSIELTSGYTAAMAVEEPGRGWEYAVGAVLLVLVAGLLIRYWDGARLPFVVALLLLTTLIEVKHGYVRHNRHVLGFFLFVLVLPLGLRLRAAATVPRLVTSALAAVATALAAQGSLTVYLEESLTSMPRAGAQLQVLASADRTAMRQQDWRQEFRQNYAVDPPILQAIDNAQVQVDPYDTAVVWAYELEWAPVPIFQQYATYTPELDRTNAAALAEPGAPDKILRARTATIDERSTAYEAPRYALATACRYREQLLSDRWQLLERTGDRCSAPRSLGSRTISAGETVDVPEPSGPQSLVYARLDLPTSPLDALVETLFKPLEPPRIRTDGVTEDLVRANAGGPLLMRVPTTAPVGPGPGGRVDVDTLSLPGLDGTAEVEFYELEVQP